MPQPVGHRRDGDRCHCRWGWEVWGWKVWGCLQPSPTGAMVQSWVQRNALKHPGPAVFNLANE